MKRLPLVIIILLAFIAVGYVSYAYGVKSVESKAYDAGYSDGRENAETSQAVIARQTEIINGLQADYKELVDKYNQLVNYANTPQYKPLRCTSTDIGFSTYTNCY